MKFFKRIFILCLVALLCCCVLAGCLKNNSQSLSNDNKELKLQLSWNMNFTNNYFCGVNVQPITYFMMEGLYNRLDTVDYVVPVLADGMPQYSPDGSTCTIKIKQNAKWQNGEDFKAEDVVAFYMMQHTTVTNYMLSIEALDDKTLLITWNNQKPLNQDIKTKLFALDLNGSIKYSEYSQYVDRAKSLLASCRDADYSKTTSTPFGKDIDSATSVLYNQNYTAFQQYSPVFYVATGPYKLDKYSATQMVLVKNEYYHDQENLTFDRVIAYNYSDINQVLNALINNEVYYYDGIPEETQIKNMLARNSNLVHLKMLDIATVGINFNLKKDVWKNPKVRLAMQYIFDREEIKNLANPYAIVNPYASTTMPASEINKFLSAEHIDKLTRYSQNWEKATQLLTEAGWTKKNGTWYDENNKKVSIQMATSNSHPIWNNATIAAQAQLASFGIECLLKVTDQGALFQNGKSETCPYDCVVMWTELNDTLSHPYGSFNAFKSQYAYFTHLPRFNRGDPVGNGTAYAEDLNLEFPWIDGGVGINGRTTVNYSEYINQLYSMDATQLEKVTASIVCGMADMCYGVNFFQNVTGSVWNVGMVKGVALPEQWSVNSNVLYIPDITSEDAVKVAQMNIKWADATPITLGILKPNVK